MGLFDFGKPKDEVLQEKLDKLNNKIEKKRIELNNLIKEKITELEVLKKQISAANDDLTLQEFGVFERRYKFTDSTQYKKKLDDIRAEEKAMIKNATAAIITSPLAFNGSEAKGKAMQKKLVKAAIRGFNGEADGMLSKIIVSNLESKTKALFRSFEQLNKIYEMNMVQINSDYGKLKLKEFQVAAEYELKKQEDKELLKEQREQEREDKKLQAELAAKRKQIAKDREHFKNALDSLREKLANANDDERLALQSQLSEFEDKLSELDELEDDVDYREGHATAGYVYVISNIGSFGEDVYKVGVTRRLEPLDRINELSSASVPFKFDVHALIFSEEAFVLETELHNELSKYRVNKVNNRKEYFKAPFSVIKNILEKHNELAVELTENVDAFEYHQSIKM